MDSVNAAIYAKLSGDATLLALLAKQESGIPGIYLNKAPLDALEPLIVYQQATAVDNYTLGSTPIFTDILETIKAIDKGEDDTAAVAIAARIQVLLNNQSLTIGGKPAMIVRVENRIDYDETTNGVSFLHRGAQYRIGALA